VYPEDILILIYPNKYQVESIVVLDPFDKKVEFYPVDSINEVKEILKRHLPFCSQDHEPMLHFGSAYVLEWEHLSDSRIKIDKPEDIDKVLS